MTRPKSILITGATGNLGSKLRRHFTAGVGYELRLLCNNPLGDPTVTTADLSLYDDRWAQHFAEVDAVIHLAGDPSPRSPWASIQRHNIDLTMNVFHAAARHGAKRSIFASSNWVMAGYRFGTERLTTDLPPWPINPYGYAKLFGERVGVSFAERNDFSFIAFRIGWCQKEHDNRPGAHMTMGRWGQEMWLSDRDLCQAMERAVLAEDVRHHVLNLMSDNPGMRWDIDETRRAIGYAPQDGHVAELSEEIEEHESIVRLERELAGRLEKLAMMQRW
jgi:NAD+ dependent glucose-6-phosphate dehydrogenase